MKAHDITAAIVDRLIEQIEAGAAEFAMPWHTLPAAGFPINATTRSPYRGANLIGLWLAGVDHGYPTAEWATYKQWAAIGAQVRKGERATPAVKWVEKRRRDDNNHDRRDRDDTARRRLIPVGFSLFNADQVDGYTTQPVDRPDGPERDSTINAWFDAIPATIVWGGPDACYLPALDRVRMPAWEAFRSADAAWSTLAHELAHWTGHRSRLDRDLTGRFGSDAYAIEELTAELSAAFTCARLGLDVTGRADHAAYLASWCRVLRAEPMVLHTVAGAAHAATDHLDAYQPTGDEPAVRKVAA